MPRVRYKAVIVHIELEGLGPIKNVDVCKLARNKPIKLSVTDSSPAWE
jgi:hypothetical protein